MLVDLQTASFNEQTVTADTLGDTLDLKAKGYYGAGDPLYFCVAVSAMDKGNGNETYSVKLQSSATVSGGNAQNPKDVPGVVMTFDRNDGSDFKFMTVPGTEELSRYVAAAANVGGTTPSFKVTAWLTGIKPETPPLAGYDQNAVFAAYVDA